MSQVKVRAHGPVEVQPPPDMRDSRAQPLPCARSGARGESSAPTRTGTVPADFARGAKLLPSPLGPTARPDRIECVPRRTTTTEGLLKRPGAGDFPPCAARPCGPFPERLSTWTRGQIGGPGVHDTRQAIHGAPGLIVTRPSRQDGGPRMQFAHPVPRVLPLALGASRDQHLSKRPQNGPWS